MSYTCSNIKCESVCKTNGQKKQQKHNVITTASSEGYWYHSSDANCSKPIALCGSVCSQIHTLCYVDSGHTCIYDLARRWWVQRCLRWGWDDWNNMFFTNKFRFNVKPGNRCIRIWKELGTRNNPAFMHASVRFAGGGC